MTLTIRPERESDTDTIAILTKAAFELVPYSDHSEAAVIDRLRRSNGLELSLVAVEPSGKIVGHIAFSRASVARSTGDIYGLGPLAVCPRRQSHGIGSQLVREGLEKLRERGAQACVLVGDPAFYKRFGFTSDPELTYVNLADQYVMRIVFEGPAPKGEIAYHPAFDHQSA